MPPTKGRKKRGIGKRKKSTKHTTKVADALTHSTASTTLEIDSNKRKEAPGNFMEKKEDRKRVNYSRNSSTLKSIEFFTQLEQLPPDKLYKAIAAVRTKLNESTVHIESITSALCDIITIDSEDEE